MLRFTANRLLCLACPELGVRSAACQAACGLLQASFGTISGVCSSWRPASALAAGCSPSHHAAQQQLPQQVLQPLHQLHATPVLIPGNWPCWHDTHSSSFNRRGICSTAATSSEDSGSSDSSSSASANGAAMPRPRDMAIVFTCAKCDTRSVKTFSRQAYEAGLVLITCPGCKAMHLIADHLGWFGDTGFKIDEYLAAQGQQVKRASLDPQQQDSPAAKQQVTAEDIAGWSKVQQLLTTVASAAGSQSASSTVGGCCGGIGGHNHESGSSSSSSSSSSSGGPSQPSQAGSEAGGVADAGVVQVAPEDVAAWARVQAQQQQQQQQQ